MCPNFGIGNTTKETIQKHNQRNTIKELQQQNNGCYNRNTNSETKPRKHSHIKTQKNQRNKTNKTVFTIEAQNWN